MSSLRAKEGQIQWFIQALMLVGLLLPGFTHAQSSIRRVVNFEWEPIEGALSYQIEITPTKASARPYVFTSKKPQWSGKLPPGHYSMRLRSMDARKVPGDWSENQDFAVKLEAVKPVSPSADSAIRSKSDSSQETEFKWAPAPGAQQYQVKIVGSDGKTNLNLTTSDTFLKVKLNVAQEYMWSVIALDQTQNSSDEIAPINFKIIGKKVNTPAIQKPENAFVRELQWKPSPFASQYKLSLNRYNEQTQKWEPELRDHLTEETKFDFSEKLPGGKYRAQLQALSANRDSSSLATAEFMVRHGDRSPAAENRILIRESINRTSGWYAIASYLLTQINYSGRNLDQNSQKNYQVLGGTGRLGAGYLNDDSPWGFLGIIDLSGFILEEKNYTYPALETMAIYRSSLGEISEYRLSSGVYYKELPETNGNARTGDVSLIQLTSFGLHLGAEYWYPLSPKLGLQTNARIYIPIGGSTPGGTAILPDPSYQLGILGSYRLQPKMTGLVGYAFRRDAIRYETLNKDILGANSFNETSVEGHYVNFYLEWDY